jgi:hypothetical protein
MIIGFSLLILKYTVPPYFSHIVNFLSFNNIIFSNNMIYDLRINC